MARRKRLLNETELDDILESLVSLKDGQRDQFGNQMGDAIQAIKEYRRQRIEWRNMRGELINLRKLAKAVASGADKMRERLSGAKK